MSKRIIKYIAIISLMLIIGMYIIIHTKSTKYPYRKAISANAQNINEWYMEDGLLPDFIYVLRADIDKTTFDDYIKHFDMKKYEDESHLWDQHHNESWWNPTNNLDTTYYNKHDQYFHFTKYENGHIYVYAGAH